MTAPHIKAAGDIEPGNIILVEGYDERGMSKTYTFPVATVRRYARRVRLTYANGATPTTLMLDHPLRVR